LAADDAAVEEADFLTAYASKVILVHRRDELRASKILQKRLMENPKAEIIWNKVVEQIDADCKGLREQHRVCATSITHQTSDLAAQGVLFSSASVPIRNHFRSCRSR
jgi:thioredoxin reductase (NADPH)